MRRRWVLIGLVLLGGGLTGASIEDSPHHACTTGLGAFGSLAGDAARNCAFHNTMFLAGVAAAVFGLGVVVAALLLRP